MARSATAKTIPRRDKRKEQGAARATSASVEEISRLRSLVSSAIPRSTPVLLTDIRNPNYRLTRPLPVTLEYEAESVMACAYDVGMYGEGEDAQSALDDLCDCILEYYEYLGEHTEDLGGVPARDWRVLSDLIHQV